MTFFRIACFASALATIGLLIFALTILGNSASAVHEILAMVTLCAAGLSWLATIVCAAVVRVGQRKG